MRRRNILITPVSIFFTVLSLSAIFVGYFVRGGEIFSPGRLTGITREGVVLNGFRSHLEFEEQCDLCHQPLQSDMAMRCLECHFSIQEQINYQEDLHGTLPDPNVCISCHLDHKGENFDPSLTARFLYDHNLARFSLVHHVVDYSSAPIECNSCHNPRDFVVNEINCKTCHEQAKPDFMNQHMQDFPLACLSCHDGLDRMVNFDHATTTFPLTGGHADQTCGKCHTGGNFADMSVECGTCHEEPTVHAGLFSTNCQECHTTTAWQPASFEDQVFDHTNTAGFSLDKHILGYQDEPINCQSCHALDDGSFNQQSCINCHMNHDEAFIQQHQVEFGSNCLACHDGFDRMANFDHNQFFTLDGHHAELDCQECHLDHIYSGTTSECAGCHQEPPIHAGAFGTSCQSCHLTDAWVPAKLLTHNFPLDHGDQGVSDCQVCHVASYAEYTCYGCHEHNQEDVEEEHREEGISMEDLPACIDCHSTGQKDE